MNLVVLDKHIDTSHHNLRTLFVREDGDTFQMVHPELFEEVVVGDSIVKRAGSAGGLVFNRLGQVRSFHIWVSCE